MKRTICDKNNTTSKHLKRSSGLCVIHCVWHFWRWNKALIGPTVHCKGRRIPSRKNRWKSKHMRERVRGFKVILFWSGSGVAAEIFFLKRGRQPYSGRRPQDRWNVCFWGWWNSVIKFPRVEPIKRQSCCTAEPFPQNFDNSCKMFCGECASKWCFKSNLFQPKSSKSTALRC